mmetsp:Transcript_15104/g.22251  ORF Transcript_15104/g.22251 Transcript_15104/m.22251 type:complete len:634 (-) Transcript_15104:535-2436(-)|eukprot:CAMPEP_0194227502 /NCGR_PEP_ID=MMETSP0156-20130528/42890_1 /TAXON_ID=33649 /ORGANISM="Thalassionema nitzschioides, Strain L26-B" /LENGTH=633 /DNA_ID=CAMNT_0038959985 /DNA_START=65 /DNA_END=1966 /DNA_ORIENTATION=-
MAVKGIIRPPPDIRAVADKTALFVSKNGRGMETKILNSEQGQAPKFSFLHDNSPFHAYYEDRIRRYQEGETDKEDAPTQKEEEKKEDQSTSTPAIITKPSKQAIKSALDPIAKALLHQRKKIRHEHEEAIKAERDKKAKAGEAPNTDNPGFAAAHAILVEHPTPLHYVNITAPRNLTAVEVETIKLVAQFTAFDSSKNFLQNLTIREWNNPTFAFLQPRNAQFAYFSALTDCYKHVLETALDNDAYQVKSIEACLNLTAYRAEFEHYAEERQLDSRGEEDDANMIDWHDFVVVETIDFSKDETVQPLTVPTEIDEMEESDDDEGETIRVVPNYTPKVVASNQTNKSQTHAIDPITGMSVPVSETSEHLRIQLLDPKWAEEKRKFQEKQKESNLVAGDAIATNLSRVVGDTADTSDLHGDAKRRLEEANRIMQEQAQPQPGPMLQPPGEPPTKRPRVDLHPPPPPPPAFPPGFPPMEGMLPLPPASVNAAMPPPPPVIPTHGMPPVMSDFNVSTSTLSNSPDTSKSQTKELLPEAEFKASLDSTEVTLETLVPHDPSSQWNFNGQTLSLQVDVMTQIRTIKDKLRVHLNDISANKLQLKHVRLGFLKDNSTLAQLNLNGVISLEIIPKTRGGRK